MALGETSCFGFTENMWSPRIPDDKWKGLINGHEILPIFEVFGIEPEKKISAKKFLSINKNHQENIVRLKQKTL